MNYKIINSDDGTIACIQKFFGEDPLIWTEGDESIPPDPANFDYQEYLAWVAEGNTAEPADEE